MNIINLTPHDINIFDENNNEIIIESSGIIARCDVKREEIKRINNIRVNKSVFGQVNDLPKKVENTIYIVSRIVAEAAIKDRDDLYFVDETIRNDKGQIIGCKSLAQI